MADAPISKRWFSSSLFNRLLPVPILVVISTTGILVAVWRRQGHLPFVLTLCLAVLGYIGLFVSVWSYAIPTSSNLGRFSSTLWDAVAPRESQRFAVVGAVIIVPIIMICTRFGYWNFREKLAKVDPWYD